MIDQEAYRRIIKKVFKHKKYGFKESEDRYLEDDDFIILLYLLGYLEEKEFKDIKNKRIANLLNLENDEVKESIERLKKANVLIEENSEYNFGFKLCSSLNDETAEDDKIN